MSKTPDAKKAAADTAEEHPLVRGLRWIVENRGVAMGKLSLDAGLKSRSHVEQILAGRIRPENVGVDAARRLARAGNVRTEWLITGCGPREPHEDESEIAHEIAPPAPERSVEIDPRYQRAEAVIAYWDQKQPGKYGPEAKAAARSRQLRADEDPSADDWEAFLDAIQAVVRGKSKLGVEVEDDESLVPPRARKKR